MIRTVIFGLLLALPVLGGAQESADAAELARISAERDRAEAEFANQEKACYSRFAVNDCIDKARKHRRDILSVLRRQELAINDAERRRRAADRVREIEARQAAQRAPSATPADTGAATRETATTLPAPGTGAAQPPTGPLSVAAPAPERGKARSPQPEAGDAPPARTPKAPPLRPAAEAQDNARRFQERLLEAEQHKKRAREKAAENNKAAKPLPVPP